MTKRDDWDDGVEFADEADDIVRSFTVVDAEIPEELPAIEALVQGGSDLGELNEAQKALIALVDDSRSVAELSALSGMPLGAVRVLIAQMINAGSLDLQQTVSPELSKDSAFLRRLRELVSSY